VIVDPDLASVRFMRPDGEVSVVPVTGSKAE
jgi:hypothetical protein